MSDERTAPWIILEMTSYLIGIILILLSIYQNIKLWPQRNEMFIKKRASTMHFTLNTSFIIQILSLYLMLFSHWFGFGMIIFIGCCWLSSLWFLFFALITKNWMVYFKHFWTFNILESEWKNIINPVKNQQNWFIKNNHKYGNLLYMNKFIASWCGLGLFLCITPWILLLPFYDTKDSNSSFRIIVSMCLILAFGTFMIAIIFYSYIVKKTPNLDDIYHIHWESKIHSKLLLLFLFLLIITQCLTAFRSAVPNHDIANLKGHDFWIFTAPICSIPFFIMNYVSTQIICAKIKMFDDDINYDIVTVISSGSRSGSLSNISVDTILSNELSLHLLMLHLSKEYSMECLLSMIEIIQFQQYLLLNCLDENDKKNIVKDENVILIDFPSNIPESAIITNKENISDTFDGDRSLFIAKMKAHKLFTKYIKVHSEYEINIAWKQRKHLTNILNDKQALISYNIGKRDIFLMFEPCKKEMFQLLRHSISRIQCNSEGNKIESALYPTV